MNDENLVPVKPGQILNPKGRGKGGISMTTLLKRMLKTKEDIRDKDGHVILRASRKRLMLLKWMEKAIKGDIRAIEGIVERVEGKVKTTGELTLKNGNASLTDEQLEEIVKKNQGEHEG